MPVHVSSTCAHRQEVKIVPYTEYLRYYMMHDAGDRNILFMRLTLVI